MSTTKHEDVKIVSTVTVRTEADGTRVISYSKTFETVSARKFTYVYGK